MSTLGVDFSAGPPSVDALKAAGVRFVGRYHGSGGRPKLLTRAEAGSYKQAGIQVVSIYETWGFSRPQDRGRLTRAAGSADARQALKQALSCGAPADVVVYFTFDYDVPAADLARIQAYLEGCATVLGGTHRVGVYGGYRVVKAMLDAGACRYAMQTRAWSSGHWDARAQIQQFPDGAPMALRIGGVACDRDRATAADFGQWGGQRPTALVDVLVDGERVNDHQRVDNPALWVRVQGFAKTAQEVRIVRSH